MKNKIPIYLLVILFFSTSSVNGQITISPEIGLSYLPFTFYETGTVDSEKSHSQNPNILLGVSAQIPIYNKWNTRLRIFYTDRNDVQWRRRFSTLDSEWNHQDLNIDLTIRYQLFKNISIGTGPSLIRSFMEFIDGSEQLPPQKINKFFFGLNAGISLTIKRVNVNFMYLRTRRFNGRPDFLAPNGDNRLDLTIGYRIGKGK